MSNEKETGGQNASQKLSPTQLIEKEIKEKTAQLQGLANKVQEAKNFVQQNEPNVFALNGAIQQLNILKKELSE